MATFSGDVNTQPPDSGTNANWTGSVTTSYASEATTVTDQAGKVRRSIVDGLGRLNQVIEDPNGAAAYTTTYGYDARGNLKIVTQGPQSRTFSYDGLSRLLNAANPESGTINYTYDANSNLKTKQDARLITTTYDYDALNRVTTRTYTNDPQNTAAVNYYYDSQMLPAGAPTFTRGSSTGRLVAVCYGGATVSAGSYRGYDSLGRAGVSVQQTDGQNYSFSYGYNLASMMTSETYPSGRTITNGYDAGGRLSSVNGQKTGEANKTYASSFSYTAHEAVASLQLGNGKWEHTTFNTRLQPTRIGLGSSSTNSSTLQLDYGYGTTANNGNVLTQMNTVSGSPNVVMTQSYSYDSLNRLQSASENSGASWSQTYGYDRYGNRWVSASTGYTLNSLTPQSSSAFNAANNRLVASAYDAAGNQTVDGQNRTFTYDAENRQLTFNATGGQYFYDGDGHRVKKIDGTGTTVFVYNAGGQLIAEYHNDPVPPAAGGGGTSYLTSDHLGSTRVVTDAQGNVKARHDFLPFGEDLGATIGPRTTVMKYDAPDSTKQKFTQKERDNESGLDYFLARYYSSAQGRFTSCDEFVGGPDELFDFSGAASSNPTFYADLTDPQSLNKYQYCYNNPLLYIDPDGHQGIKKWIQDTLRGAAAAFNADNGLPTPSGDQTTTGRTIGHLAAITQGVTEVVTGGNMIVGGGTEAVVTSPAATTVVGAVVPAAGVGVAVAGGALVVHGGGVLINTTVNIFKKGDTTASNSQQQSQPQQSQPGPTREVTPRTNSKAFEAVKGSPAKRNKESGEIWVKDRLHKDHYEVYKNQKKFENGKRNRSVWEDGRAKEKF